MSNRDNRKKDPTLPAAAKDDGHDDDSLDDDDDDDGDLGRLHFMAASWRAVETAALSIPDNGGGDHGVIMSRLGGTVSSTRRLGGVTLTTLTTTTTTTGVSETTGLLADHEAAKEGKDEPRRDKHDAVPPPPPPLMRWLWVALFGALAYALYNICIKKGSADVHPVLGGVILQFVAAVLGAALLAAMVWTDPAAAPKIRVHRAGVAWSMGAGAWVGIAEITSFVVSGMGVPATQFIPINIGGSVVFGAILGVILLGETCQWQGWTGVVLLMAGIAAVATDPGEKVEEGGGGQGASVNDAPPLIVWIGPALFCALSYALYNICIKKGSAHVNPIVGAVILQFVAAILGTCMLSAQCLVAGVTPHANRQGILWACWAGIFVGVAELLSFCVSGMGVPATQSIPILIGGSVMFGAVLGILMLGEELELQGWSGVVVLMLGIGLVAADPGEKVQGH